MFPHNSSKLGCHLCHLSLALFLLCCLCSLTTVHFQHDSLLFSPLPLLKCFCTLQQQHVPSVPSTFTSCSLHCKVRCIPYQSSNVSSPSVPAAMPITIGALVSFFHLGSRTCRDLVYGDVLQRDGQFFVWQRGAMKSVVQQTLKHQLFHC